MDIEIAILIAGALAMVGGVVGGGAIYSGLMKIAEALKEKKLLFIFNLLLLFLPDWS